MSALPTMHSIASTVAGQYGFTIAELRSASRIRPFVIARQHAWAEMKAQGRWTLMQMARCLHRSSPAGVCRAIAAHTARLARPVVIRPAKPIKPAALTQAQKRAEALRERTIANLQWAHGTKRAKAIIEGRDPATNADISAWDRLGVPKAQRGRA